MSGNGFDTVGITGYSQLASVTDSVNKDTVSGNENTGGIAGKISASGTADLHSGCRNEGAVSGITKTGSISGTSTGKGRKPSVKVKDAKGNILAENDDYTVSYSILPAENPSAPPGCL